MKTNLLPNFLDKFRESFSADILVLLNELRAESSLKPIEALCIYSVTGFESIGYAFRREDDIYTNENSELDSEFLALLEGHSDLQAIFSNPMSDDSHLYSQICADEWLHINEIDCFSGTNALVCSNFDQLYDAGIVHQVIQVEMLNIIVSTLSTMLQRGEVSEPLFTAEPFISVQFSGGIDRGILIESSKQLNSLSWHNKVERFVKENFE